MKTSSNALAVVPNVVTPTARVDMSARRFSLGVDASLDRRAHSLIWELVPREARGIPTSSDVIANGPPKHCVGVQLEHRLIDVLTRPLACNETHATGNANREKDIRTIFAALAPIAALVIRRRLEADRPNDTLVAAFRRLIPERRSRLIAYLADPRRGK